MVKDHTFALFNFWDPSLIKNNPLSPFPQHWPRFVGCPGRGSDVLSQAEEGAGWLQEGGQEGLPLDEDLVTDQCRQLIIYFVSDHI